MKVSVFQRFALWSLLAASVVLTGCAGIAKVNPTRTEIMFTYSVSPGADGTTTTKTDKCTFRKQVSFEQAQAYEKDPALLVPHNACKEFDKVDGFGQLALHGSPTLAGELTKIGTAAVANGGINYLVQTALQKQQAKNCRNGGCITTVNQNNNNNVAVAEGGDGGAGGNANAAAGAVAGANAEANATGGGTCATCALKPKTY